MYLYETHLHTSPVSRCARATVRETIEYYKEAGYAGVFLTDHFLPGILPGREDEQPTFAERIEYYFSAYEEGKKIGDEIGIDVFPGIEMGQGWAHILVYGVDKEWCLRHEDMLQIKMSELMTIMQEDGALLVQAHPFRTVKEAITLFPRHVHGVEIYNASRTEFENALAVQYRENYSLIPFAGSDNHTAGRRTAFGGMATERPVKDVQDFIQMVLNGEAKPFVRDENGVRLL